MTHAAPPPRSRDEMATALSSAHWGLRYELGPTAWNLIADLVQAWIAYERERAIEEAAQCCDVLSEKSRALPEFNSMARWCADAIRALKVVP